MKRAAFSVGSRTYRWGDVLLAARLGGEWEELERETRTGLTAAARAARTGAWPSPEELAAAAAEFRYERDLVAAQEMEAWLERRGLTVDAWLDFLRRSLLRKALASSPADAEAELPVDDAELARAVEVDLLCSGTLPRLAARLAERAALHEGLGGGGPASGECDGEGADGGGGGDTASHLRGLAESYLRFRESAVTPEAVREQIAARSLDWIRLDCRLLRFLDGEPAREAALCLREDGLDPVAVAAEAGVPLETRVVYLEDLDASTRPSFLGVRPGEMLGPLDMGGEHVLVLVVDKTLPDGDDPEVRRRAEERILGTALEREAAQRVRWVEEL